MRWRRDVRRAVIRLSDHQLEMLFNASRPVAVDRRDEFLRAVAVQFAERRGGIGDGELYRLLLELQRKYCDYPDTGWGGALGRRDPRVIGAFTLTGTTIRIVASTPSR
jgi:hypothetical protein